MAECHCTSSIRTSRVGTFFNAAIARLGRQLVFSANADAISSSARARNCTSEHRIEIRSFQAEPCGQAGEAPLTRRRSAFASLLTSVSSAQPQRVCIDLLNYRGNGPEGEALGGRRGVEVRRSVCGYVER